MGTLELRGLRLVVSIGLLPEERERRQPIEVDLDVELDLTAAAASDRMDDGVDYGAVVEAVSAALTSGHVDLLERAAGVVCSTVLALDDRIEAVEAVVRKLRPPVPSDLGTAAVRLRRSRSG